MPHCHDLTPKLLAHEAEAGDALALEIIAETARYLGVGIVNLMHTIDPGCVLLGGAMTFGGHDSDLGLRFLGWIKEEVERRAFRRLAQRTVIDFANLGGDAGYIGAAGMAGSNTGNLPTRFSVVRRYLPRQLQPPRPRRRCLTTTKENNT